MLFLGVNYAQNPDPYKPARQSIQHSNTFILKWNRGPIVSNVDVHLDTNLNFSTAQVFTNIASDSLVFTSASQKKYFWKICYTGQSNFSSVYDFRYYNPSSAGGLKGWFSALGLIQANNTPITTWNSLEVAGNATNTPVANCPVYFTSGGLANKPRVAFRPPYQKLNTQINGADISNTDPLNVYFLGKLNNQSQAYSFIYSLANFNTYSPAQHNRAAYNYNGAANFLLASNGPSGSAQYFISTSANTWRMITAVDNTSQAKLYRNGQFIASNPSSVYSVHTNSPLILGGYVDNVATGVLATSNMDVSEMLFFNTEHPDSIRLLIEKSLVQRYIKPVNLGKDTSVNPLCGSLLLNAGTGYASYLWSSGATTQTYSVTSPGTYWVQVNDGFGHTYSDTIVVRSLSSFNQLPSKVYLCQGSQLIWQTNLPNVQYDYEWNDLSNDSSLVISSPGFYYVKITQTLSGCSFISDTVEVVNDPFPIASLGNDTTLCLNNDLFLNQDVDAGSTFLWSTGENTESINITSAGTYWVQAINQNNCLATDTIQVLVSGIAPVIDFSIQNRCETSTAIYTASSNLNPINYTWNFGDGTFSNSASGNHVFANPGVYKVSLNLLADNGCANLIKKDIVINSKPQVNFTYTDTCSNDSVRFVGQVLPISGGIQSVLWDFNNPTSGIFNSATTLNSAHVYQLPGNYFVTLSVQNDSNCQTQFVRPIHVKEGAYPEFNFSGLCFSSPTVFSNQSTFGTGISPNSYTWYFGNGNQSNLFNPQVIYNSPDSYQVTLRVTTNNQCKAYKTKIIPVLKGAQAEFSMPDSICSYATIPFLNQSIGINDTLQTYLWRFGSAATSTLANPSFAFTQAGTRIVRLITTTQNGCKDSIQYSIQVLTSPDATFTVGQTVGEPPFAVTPVFVGANAENLYWDFGNGTQSNQINPGEILYETGDYNLSLVAESSSGCKDSHNVFIEVRPIVSHAEWLQVACNEVNGQMYFSGTLLNTGNIKIESFDVAASIDYTTGFVEKWVENMPVGASKQIVLNASMPLNEWKAEHFCCLNITEINGLEPELEIRKCIAKESEFWVSTVYPNPSSDQIQIEYILKDEEVVQLSMYDMNGKLVYTSEMAGKKGLNSFKYSINHLRKGVYVVKLKEEVRKFTKM